MSDIIKAILLGIVEGITEFIPVSSTGHLILTGELLEFHGAKEATFDIFIQLGAILAVVFLYFDRFKALLDFSSNEAKHFNGLNGISKLFIACIPAFILGYLFHGLIKEHLFSSFTVALALIIGGIIMIAVEHRKSQASIHQLEEISYLKCLGIGIFQCFALWPGMSRSGSTIVGGMLLGLNRKIAAEFSFLVAVPVMCAAVAYDLWKSSIVLAASDILVFAVGFIVSFIIAILAIKFFINLLGKYTLKGFGYYRIVIGLIVLLV